MGAFLYGLFLQWKLDIRSKTLLIPCYIVPLLFFLMMGGIFASVMPQAQDSLVQSMTVFGVTMGSLIGLPPSLVEIYGGNIKRVYIANGIPMSLGVVLTNLSAFIHLFAMSVLLFFAAPLIFGAQMPGAPAAHFAGVAVLIAVSLGVASVIGLAIKDQAKTPVFSILVFLPSILLSGIMFPSELLPKALAALGKMFPATWGYVLLKENAFRRETVFSLLVILAVAVFLCAALLRRGRE